MCPQNTHSMPDADAEGDYGDPSCGDYLTVCAHNGVINILEHFHAFKGRMPNYVIGGFHLSSRTSGNEDSEMIDRIGKYLIGTKAKFYTCHCTGIEPYKKLKAVMGDSIDYLSAGSEIII